MFESIGTAVLHFILLGAQIACLSSLACPYLAALRARRWSEHIMNNSWGFGRFLGDFAAVSLFVLHLLIWSQESNFASELAMKTVFLFYGWTAMLAVWTVSRYNKAKNEAQEESRA